MPEALTTAPNLAAQQAHDFTWDGSSLEAACVWGKLKPANADGIFDKLQEKYIEPIFNFSREKIDVGDILSGPLPWTSAAEQVAARYDKSLFHNINCGISRTSLGLFLVRRTCKRVRCGGFQSHMPVIM